MRDELWARALKATRNEGSVIQVWSSNNAQGFCCRQHGPSKRVFVDFDGLTLVRRSDSRNRAAQDADTTA